MGGLNGKCMTEINTVPDTITIIEQLMTIPNALGRFKGMKKSRDRWTRQKTSFNNLLFIPWEGEDFYPRVMAEHTTQGPGQMRLTAVY